MWTEWKHVKTIFSIYVENWYALTSLNKHLTNNFDEVIYLFIFINIFFNSMNTNMYMSKILFTQFMCVHGLSYFFALNF